MKYFYTFDKNLKLRATKSLNQEKKTGKNNSRLNEIEKYHLAKYFSIGYYLLTPLLVGVFSGLYIDKKFGFRYFVLVGIAFGLVSTFYNLYRLTKN